MTHVCWAEMLRRYFRGDEHAVAYSAHGLTDHGFCSIGLRRVNEKSAALKASS
jgi:hypothetical protein